MIPQKLSVFSNIGENFAETLQFEHLVVKHFFLFYYVHIFVKKNGIGIKCIFYECWKERKKKNAEKNHGVFEGLKGGPFEHTKTFFSAKCFKFFFNIHKKCNLYQFKLFWQTCAGNKKERNFDHKVFKL